MFVVGSIIYLFARRKPLTPHINPRPKHNDESLQRVFGVTRATRRESQY